MGDYPTTAGGVASEEADNNGMLEYDIEMAITKLNQARNELKRTNCDVLEVIERIKAVRNVLQGLMDEVLA